MIEEKLKERSLLNTQPEHYGKIIPYDNLIKISDALSICKQEIEDACKKARLEEHKDTVLYWETLPRNERYGIDYHFNRIRELSSPLDEVK